MKLSNLLRYLLRGYLLRAVDDEPSDDDGGQEDDDVSTDADGDGEGDGGEDEGSDAAANDEGGEVDEDGADDDLVVSLGDEEGQQEDERRAPEWTRELRKKQREMARAIRQKDEEIARLKGASSQPASIVVGDEPDPDNYEMWDPAGKAKFKEDWNAWNGRKRDAEEQQRTRAEAEARDREAWQRTQDAYSAAKGALKVPNFDDAEGAVEDAFSTTQRGILLHALAPKQAALMIYALGNSPQRLAELSAITDPVKFTFAVAKLEEKLKVTKSKAAPPPERTVRGTVSGAAVVDNQMERLRAEARKTGDYSKVAEHRRQLDAKQRKRA
jgi:hypothetical protein